MCFVVYNTSGGVTIHIYLYRATMDLISDMAPPKKCISFRNIKSARDYREDDITADLQRTIRDIDRGLQTYDEELGNLARIDLLKMKAENELRQKKRDFEEAAREASEEKRCREEGKRMLAQERALLQERREAEETEQTKLKVVDLVKQISDREADYQKQCERHEYDYLLQDGIERGKGRTANHIDRSRCGGAVELAERHQGNVRQLHYEEQKRNNRSKQFIKQLEGSEEERNLLFTQHDFSTAITNRISECETREKDLLLGWSKLEQVRRYELSKLAEEKEKVSNSLEKIVRQKKAFAVLVPSLIRQCSKHGIDLLCFDPWLEFAESMTTL